MPTHTVHMHLSTPLALCALMAATPCPGPAQTDSLAIVRLVANYDSAWNRRDSLAVSRLLAPNYQYFTSRGGLSSRKETMRFLADSSYHLERARRSELSITLTGPVAIVSSRWQGHGTYRGERFVDDQRCGQTWVRSGESWQLLSEHCTQIAPPADSQS